jgi:hypothetical protein
VAALDNAATARHGTQQQVLRTQRMVICGSLFRLLFD